jgi:hypothetical protein
VPAVDVEPVVPVAPLAAVDGELDGASRRQPTTTIFCSVLDAPGVLVCCDEVVCAPMTTLAHAATAAHTVVPMNFFMQPPAAAACNDGAVAPHETAALDVRVASRGEMFVLASICAPNPARVARTAVLTLALGVEASVNVVSWMNGVLVTRRSVTQPRGSTISGARARHPPSRWSEVLNHEGTKSRTCPSCLVFGSSWFRVASGSRSRSRA